MRRLLLAVVLALAALGGPAWSHEARPGYLELREVADGRYDVLWKQPASGDLTLQISPVFPDSCRLTGSDDKQLLPGALVTRFSLLCQGGLAGKEITIAGLEMTLTDVLVRLYRGDGGEETHLARNVAVTVRLGEAEGVLARSATFLRLGVQHIVQGVDHLLFVLGLLLIVGDLRTLVKTISAFTLAHSLTLAAATLGFVSVPAPPLNAAIALSILFLGPEIMRARIGETSLTIRHPWVVAFLFGLLHGFGFASGLAAMGLPRGEIPLALLLFNVGVEIGQLAFVGLILWLARSFRLLEIRWPQPLPLAPAYAVGGLGAYWTIQRLTLLLVTGA